MNNETGHAMVAELRREFDAGFAMAPRAETAQHENLLAIRVGGDGYALRVAQIAGLHAGKPVSPLPTPMAELKGLAGFRGRAAPVYDLAALLGYGASADARWLVLARGGEPLALAFGGFESHFAVTPGATTNGAPDMVRAPGSTLKVSAALRPQVFDAVRFQGAMRPIIDLDIIVESIRRRCTPAQSGSTTT